MISNKVESWFLNKRKLDFHSPDRWWISLRITHDINYKITPDIEEGVEYALSMLSKEERDILIAVYNGIPNSTVTFFTAF